MSVLDNPRHERFAQELAKGKTADEAYQDAGYSENRGNASTLKAKQNISNRVAEILSAVAAKTEVTLESIANQLDEDRSLAHDVKQPGAAVAASMGKAKLFGLLIERNEHTGKDGGPILTEEVSARDFIESRIAQLATRVEAQGNSGKPH